MYFPNPGDMIQAIDAATGRRALGATAATMPEDIGDYLAVP